LYAFEIIYPKKGILRFVSRSELLSRAGLILKDSSAEAISKALETLTRKGALIEVKTEQKGTDEAVYFLNTEANRLAVEKIRNGEIKLPGIVAEKPALIGNVEPSDIFTLYEQNIGMLTPLIADELREAGKQYPENWIRDAIKEAVALNKRNWRYIARILEHWSTEGKDNGTARGYLKKDTDPDKYIRGKYGHMVQR
jgi:DnaD/phage-associated family protein